jgi:hypothetical protein
MKKILIFCALNCLLLTHITSAALIVDTGEPSDESFGYTLAGANIGPQWLAGEFTLSQAYTVTDVVGWMWEANAGDLTVAIYSDGGDVPNDSSELYSHTFTADIPDGMNSAWIGAVGVSWDLGPGTYWAGFEVRSGSGAWFAMPWPAPSPLDNYAYKGSDGWTNGSNMNFGLRIFGDRLQPVIIPAPGALLLGGFGLGFVGWLRKRRTL